MAMLNEMACRSKYDVIIVDPPLPKFDANTVQDCVPQYPHRKPKNRVPRLFPMVCRPVWPLLRARLDQHQRIFKEKVESDRLI